MNGLVAIGSPPTPQPVNAISSIGMGVWSMQAAVCARAFFPSRVAAPPTAPALMRSRLVKRVLDDIVVFPPQRCFPAPPKICEEGVCSLRAARKPAESQMGLVGRRVEAGRKGGADDRL